MFTVCYDRGSRRGRVLAWARDAAMVGSISVPALTAVCVIQMGNIK